MRAISREQLLIIGAFAVIYIVWGSTYLFNYYAIQTIPPYIMGGSRFFVAGFLLFMTGRLLNHPMPSLLHWRNAAGIGFLFFTLGVGGVVWAVQFIDTGIASLIVSLEPLLVILLLWSFFGKRPGPASILGTIFGISGIVLLVSQDHFTTDRSTVWGIVLIGVSILAWSSASVILSKVVLPKSKILSAGMQMITGGISMVLIGLVIGEFSAFEVGAIDLRAGLSWVYLVLFGSILAFTSFNFLLLKVSPDKVASCTYVNPLVALLLGWGVNDEVLTSQSALAALALLGGVVLITMENYRFKRPPRSRRL